MLSQIKNHKVPHVQSLPELSKKQILPPELCIWFQTVGVFTDISCTLGNRSASLLVKLEFQPENLWRNIQIALLIFVGLCSNGLCHNIN